LQAKIAALSKKKETKKKKFAKWGRIMLFIIGLTTALFAIQIPSTEFNYNFEEFYPANDEDSEFFYEHRERFESDNDFLMIAVTHEPSVFQIDFLERFKNLSKELENLEHVKFCNDLTKMEEQFFYASGTSGSKPYLSFENDKLKEDSARIFKNEELINNFISADGQSLLIFLRHKDFLSKNKSDELITSVENLLKELDFENVKMAGRTIGQRFYINTMVNEMATYVGFSLILVVLFLLIAFKSTWGLMVPQVVIVGSMVWIVGYMALVKEPLNILLTILPSIMFVVSMSDVVHLVSKYIELLRQGHPKFEAIIISFKEIGIATFLTSLTTAIGFFSLYFVNVIPIQTFGVYTGIGVLMAFVLTFASLPFLFYFTKPPKIAKDDEKNFWLPVMRRAFLFTMRNRKLLTVVTVILIGLFTYGMTKIVSNNYLMDDIKPKVQMKKDFNFFDATFGGIRPFELSITLKDSTSSFWKKENLKQLSTIEEYLQEEYGANIRLSLAQTMSILHRGSNAGNPDFFSVPTKKNDIRKFKRAIKVANGGNLVRLMLDSTEHITRIQGTIPDWGNIKTTAANKDFYNFITEEKLNNVFDIQLTGSAHLLDKNMSYMSSSLVKGLLFASLIVAAIMGLLFQSFRMVIISIIPNLIPLVFIAGVMGFFGIDLKITTAIVFTISFGIAVDDTIHFLTKYKLELNKGKSNLYALKRTYLDTGKAIVLTSAILCSGFLLLLFSDFLGTFYLGLMISITLLFAVLGDLFFLPILLIYFYKPKRTKSLNFLKIQSNKVSNHEQMEGRK
jgi:predicted RND superfamily exporter protein